MLKKVDGGQRTCSPSARGSSVPSGPSHVLDSVGLALAIVQERNYCSFQKS